MEENIIETFDLTKIYKLKGKKKEIRALNNINMFVKKGEIFGLLGPNGAGKTTMLNILTTLIQPTSGYALIDGINLLKKPKLAKRKVTLMLESDMLYYRITGYNNLKFFCKIYKVHNYNEKIHKMVRDFGLNKWLNQYVEYYSSGMKMKLALLRTLLLERDIMFLDEPTLGLDVKSKTFIINKLKNIDKTVIITSHDMDVIEKLCDRVAFINMGNIIKIGTKEDVKRLGESDVDLEIEVIKNKTQLKSELNQQLFVNNMTETKSGFIISLNERKKYSNLLSILSKYEILKIKEKEISLEDLFLQLI